MKFALRSSKKARWNGWAKFAQTCGIILPLSLVMSGCVAMATGETPAQTTVRTAQHTPHQNKAAKNEAPPHADNGIPEANLACFEPGKWLDPNDGAAVDAQTVFARLAEADYVLLGETHDQAEHHRWQLHTAAAIYGRHPNMALGFEMFPRAAQPVLDNWVAGNLSEAEFLRQARWGDVWNYPAEIYMPLFRFARQNRIPMVALNVEHDLVRRVRKEGWDAVPEDQREGVTKPAEPLPAYRDFLFKIYKNHVSRAQQGSETTDADKPNEITVKDEGFIRFTQSQRTWDRAMAQGMISGNRLEGRPLVVGIIGSGHLINGFGVPYQLADLGEPNSAVVLPWDGQLSCERLKPGTADAVFGLTRQAPAPAKHRPILGVMLKQVDDDVTITSIVGGSVAEKTGLKADDVVINAAGEAVKELPQLISIVQRQSPGTWLPITVLRSDKTIDLVAKFPTVR